MTDTPDPHNQPVPTAPQVPAVPAARPMPAPGAGLGLLDPAAPLPPLPPLLPWWPALTEPAPSVVPRAGATAGLAAAVATPWDRPGLGWLLVALVMAGAVVRVARGPETVPPAGSGLVRLGWAAGAVALVGVGTVRAAGWLFVLCLLAACLAGSLAVTGGRSVRAIAFGVFAVPAAALRCPPWLTRGLAARVKSGGTGARLAGSVLAGMVLLAVFGSLFAGADAAFARMASDLLPTLDGGSTFRRVVLFAVAGLGTAGACYLLAGPVGLDGPVAGPRMCLRRVEWVLPVGALVVLFTSFVLVQLVALFGGDAYVLRTAGLTYADYARSGFWQLLTVTVLTLAVIAAAARWAPTTTVADRAWLRGLLGALACLTLVIVASALTRMWSYQQAYGFTVLRLLVETCELWLGLVYLVVIIAGVRLHNTWLPSTVVASGMAALVALAALNPDRFVAQRNIARWQQTDRIDVDYLSGLSADAAQPLSRLPEPLRSCALSDLADRLDGDPDGWQAWNAGRSSARRVVATVRRPSPGDC